MQPYDSEAILAHNYLAVISMFLTVVLFFLSFIIKYIYLDYSDNKKNLYELLSKKWSNRGARFTLAALILICMLLLLWLFNII
jgi:hypothetical protein